MTKLTRLGTWIAEQERIETLPSFGGDANQLDSNAVNAQFSCIILKWTGCTPSTNIGTLYITVSISVEPVANMRGILQVQPRGSYEGTFRAFRQSRKNGIQLEFL